MSILPAQVPLVRSALKFYRATSYITCSFLLLLVIEILVHYVFGYYFWLGGPNGFISLESVPATGELALSSGVNLSKWVLIVHGWLYVAYLFGDFRLWTLLRWSFIRFVVIALGGIVPFLSFFTERYFHKIAEAQLAEVAAEGAAN
jgi:integral membrane protein